MKIFKNFRRPFPFFNAPFPVLIKRGNNIEMKRLYKFTDSSIYEFEDNDQFDINKLFGFSIGLHHNNSFRIGWRPNADLTRMEILTYCYIDSIMTFKKICDVDLNEWYEYKISYNTETNKIRFDVKKDNGEANIVINFTLKHRFNFGYHLGLYFGGNKTCPHDMIILKKI